jgi:hypothetical protein
MNNIKHSSITHANQMPPPAAHAWTPESLATIRTTARDFANPVDYLHPTRPWPSSPITSR